MSGLAGRIAGVHIGLWTYDRWYRGAWIVWPQALAILVASLILSGGALWPVSGKWGKPTDCANASDPNCAAARRAAFVFPDIVVSPTIAFQKTVPVDQNAFRSSAPADRPKLAAALAEIYWGQWQKAVEILKSAAPGDPNVQLVSALALLGQNTMDSVHSAQVLLRNAMASGQRQATAILGRALITGAGGLTKDEQEGRKLIETGVAAGDAYALRLAAVGYLSRELGAYDPAKAADLMRKSAEAGDPLAMISFAMFLESGLGGVQKSEAESMNYLRRAAEAGSTGAQFLLGQWVYIRYQNRQTEDLSESVKWYERAYQRGYNFFALTNLAYDFTIGRSAPWFNTSRSFSLLQLCKPYAFANCHFSLGVAYQQGSGTAQDFTRAYAHYLVARQLGHPGAASLLQQLDATLPAAVKSAGADLANTISRNLRAVPNQISLQIKGIEPGPSPWNLPPLANSPVQVSPPPSSAPNTQTAANSALPQPGRRPHALCSGQSREQDVLFEDKFTNGLKGWDKAPGMKIGDGEMEITLRTNQNIYTILNRKLSARSGDFCLRFTLPEPESDNGSSASIVFWAKDYSNFYSADFWSNGNLSLGQEENGTWKTLYSVDDSSRAWTGPEQVFELRVVANDGEVTTWLNGVLVRSIEARPPNGDLHFGIFLEMTKMPQTDKIFRFYYFNVLQPISTSSGR